VTHILLTPWLRITPEVVELVEPSRVASSYDAGVWVLTVVVGLIVAIALGTLPTRPR
jgi:hypothetical protein